MSRLAADRLLYNFRQNAGLPSRGASRWADGKRRPMASTAPNSAATSPDIFFPPARNFYASDRRQGSQSEGRLYGGGTGQMPGEAGRRISQRVPHGVVRPSGCPDRQAAHQPQAGAPALPGPRSTPSTKSWPACSTCTSSPATGRRCEVAEGMANWADEWSASKTEEHMQQILNDGIRRHGRIALQSRGADE